MDFADLIANARSLSSMTPRAFHASKNLECSYAYYLKIENGEAIPSPEMAISILRTLEIDLRRGMFAWARSQMPSDVRPVFTEMWEKNPPSDANSLESTILVTRLTAKLLERDPILTEIVTYLGCISSFKHPSSNEISREFGLSESDLQNKLNDLYDYGLIDRDEEGHYCSKGWLLVPQEKEFSRLRDINFRRSLEQVSKIEKSRRRHNIITRLLTENQIREVDQMIDWLTNWIVSLPDKHCPPEAQHYSVGLFMGPRLYGEMMKSDTVIEKQSKDTTNCQDTTAN